MIGHDYRTRSVIYVCVTKNIQQTRQATDPQGGQGAWREDHTGQAWSLSSDVLFLEEEVQGNGRSGLSSWNDEGAPQKNEEARK